MPEPGACGGLALQIPMKSGQANLFVADKIGRDKPLARKRSTSLRISDALLRRLIGMECCIAARLPRWVVQR